MALLSSRTAGRTRVVVGWLLGIVSFGYLLAFPPTLGSADESYILYGAKRVLQGQAVYRDFFDFLTPGSFYLYAAAYAVGGVSITTARVTTALLNALSATCTYALALHVASMAEAAVAALLVVVICVPVWNVASHHWIATAFALASAAVLLASRWQGSTRARPLAAGALAALVVCTHQDRGLWLIAWLAIAVPLLVLGRGGAERWRRCRRELAWTALGGAIVCLTVLGYAVARSSLAEMLYATHTWVLANYRAYNVGRMGWSGYNLAWADGVHYTYIWLFRWLPAILGVEVLALLWTVRRHGLRAQVVRAALLLLALSAAAAVAYYPDVIHVAFVAPFSFVVLAGLAYRARVAIATLRLPGTSSALRLAFAGVLALVMVKGWQNVRRAWTDNPVFYETAFGTLAGAPMRADAIRDLRRELHVDPGTTPRVFAYQSDAWLYLALPADNPTPFALLRPVYNTPEQIQQAIDGLERDPAARVVVNALAPEAGDAFMTYLHERFRDVASAGPEMRAGEPVYRIFERHPRG